MGRVWRAADEILDRQVAVKEMRIDGHDAEDSRTRRERTLREARATARIDHPNVVRVYDVVDEGERLWIVMELVAGRSLERILAQDGPLGPCETARIGLGLVAALRQVHARGVLHRDIKPGNVLVENARGPAAPTRGDGDGPGGGRRVVLTDFGIAAIQDAKALTMVGMLVGSPDYMAPERVSGRPQGPPSDVWSLGATLCAALGGRSPFSRATTLATLHAVLYEEPELPAGPGPLRGILTSLLEKDPSARPDLDDLATALEPVAFPAATPTVPVGRAGTPAPPRPRAPRDPREPTPTTGPAGSTPTTPPAGSSPAASAGPSPTTTSAAPTPTTASAGATPTASAGATPTSASAGSTPTTAAGSIPTTTSAALKRTTASATSTPTSTEATAKAQPNAARSEGRPEGRSEHRSEGRPEGRPTTTHRPSPVSLTRAQAPTEHRPHPAPTPTPTPVPQGDLPGPAAAGSRAGRRRTVFVATAVTLATAGAVAGIMLATSPGSPGDDDTRAGSSTSAPPTTASTPSPSVEGTSRPQSLPPGTHREAGGFAWATPDGWRRDVKTGAEVHYTSPDGTQELVGKSALARGDLLETWETSERNAHQGQDYRKIRLEETTFRGHPAVVWEYTFTLEGVHWHARLLGFNVKGKSYQVNTWYDAGIEPAALRTYEKVKDSFTVL
ncbi:serine/threonine-protein kinase [Streptomyces lomondensis]|nr:serine/threonine-protein kinase [Streptomyces lomondensis]MCF0082967.1 protein kinase [Streptomyces lomondensis]